MLPTAAGKPNSFVTGDCRTNCFANKRFRFLKTTRRPLGRVPDPYYLPGALRPFPFNIQAPVPPYFVYGTGISTYMDHFGRKKPTTRKRMVTPPRMRSQPEPKERIALPGANPGVPSRQAVKAAVHEYVNKLSANNKAVYDAMAPVFISNPYGGRGKTQDVMLLPPKWPPAAAAAATGRSPVVTSPSTVTRNEIVEEARRSAAAPTVKWKRPYTAPPPPSPPRPSAPVPEENMAAVARASSASAGRKRPTASHWICWDTGNLEPPGLQTRLVRPWPTPVPPPSARGASAPTRSAAAGGGSQGYVADAYAVGPRERREAGGLDFYSRRLYANYPMPDDIAMTDVHDTMLSSERAFAPHPENIDLGKQPPHYVPNPLPWYTEDGYHDEGDEQSRVELQHAELTAGDAWRSLRLGGCGSAGYDLPPVANHAGADALVNEKGAARLGMRYSQRRQQESRIGLRCVNRPPQQYCNSTSCEAKQRSSQYSRQHDTVNYGSTFMFTKPYRGCFTINPEWTSERITCNAQGTRRDRRTISA